MDGTIIKSLFSADALRDGELLDSLHALFYICISRKVVCVSLRKTIVRRSSQNLYPYSIFFPIAATHTHIHIHGRGTVVHVLSTRRAAQTDRVRLCAEQNLTLCLVCPFHTWTVQFLLFPSLRHQSIAKLTTCVVT